MEDYAPQLVDSQSPKSPQQRNKFKIIFIIIIVAMLGYFVLHISFGSNSFAIENFASWLHGTPAPTAVVDKNYAMPTPEPNRLDVLILGIRGEDDPDAADGGPLLTDSIQVFSYDKETKKSSLISIPRDLYVTIYGDKKDKINTAYQYGLDHTPDGLQFVKDKISQITGVYIDKVVVFDFSSFKQIVDTLGGIDVTLDKPFSEDKEWGFPFSLPAGPNHLDGQSALYYARSRYSTNDFDRSRRQQQVIFAIKDKLVKLNLFTDPIKTLSIFNVIRNNIKTDIGIWDMKQFIDLAHSVNFQAMNKEVISTDNLLNDGRIDNSYVLLTKSGDLFGIKQFFQDSLK